MNDYVHIEAADLRRPNARFTTERQGYQVLTPFGKLGYSQDFPLALSLDGNLLLVEVDTPDGRDMVLVTQGADSGVFSDYLRASWNEWSGTLSRDGRWLAYMSDESGVPEVFVRSFPEAERPQRISLGGGTQPLWDPDESAIYFRDGNRVVRAAVTIGETVSVDSLEVLFEAEWIADALGRHDWDIHPDGESFVAVKGPATEETEVDGVPDNSCRDRSELLRAASPADG